MGVLGEYLGLGVGRIWWLYVIVLAVFLTRPHSTLPWVRVFAWFLAAVAVMIVVQAGADLMDLTGPGTRIMLTSIIPLVISWCAISLATRERRQPQDTPAQEMRAIRPK